MMNNRHFAVIWVKKSHTKVAYGLKSVMGESDVTEFYGYKSILSNKHTSKFIDDYGHIFTSVEQYYIYHKAWFHGCLREAETVK